ncbi:hypothetical protein TNCV_3149151 [Trichonephila clavipes]|nr:hypothetical protein TNCV_3149151 [Trichonephila clavipes]
MPPNTLLVHTEYVHVKSVGAKVLWAEKLDWRIFPSPPNPWQNCGGGDKWCRHLSVSRKKKLYLQEALDLLQNLPSESGDALTDDSSDEDVPAKYLLEFSLNSQDYD